MTEAEIIDITGRLGTFPKACQEAGFTGVQVHAAPGYLISQFLSPRTNLRTDDYGGTLENRARILLEVVSSIRQAVGSSFPIAVKLNSADFQKGGFDFADSMRVAKWLEDASVDVIEISGGTYEQPRLLGVEGIEEVAEQDVKASTVAREAYFLDFALAMQQEVSIPLMVTGGFRQKQAMEVCQTRLRPALFARVRLARHGSKYVTINATTARVCKEDVTSIMQQLARPQRSLLHLQSCHAISDVVCTKPGANQASNLHRQRRTEERMRYGHAAAQALAR